MRLNLKLRLLRGLKNNLPEQGDESGVLYYTEDTSELFVAKGLGLGFNKIRPLYSIKKVQSEYQLASSDEVLIVTAPPLLTSYNLTLPQPFEGKIIIIKVISGSGTVVVKPSRGLIDTKTSYSIGSGSSLTLISDGTDWFII